MSIVLQSSGGGSVTLQEPSTASNVTVTIPASTGTAMVSGNMPAFSAYKSSNQTPSSNVVTKVTFDTEDYDTANCFDTSTSRFTPTVAGYYQVNGAISFSATINNFGIRIFKNGSDYSAGMEGGVAAYSTVVSNIIYLNGSTDYIELYGVVNTGAFYGHSAGGGYSRYTYFSASLIRSA